MIINYCTKKPTKKDAQKEVFKKLSGALAEYKSNLKEKEFQRNLKKASKLFAIGIVKSLKKDCKKDHVRMEVGN